MEVVTNLRCELVPDKSASVGVNILNVDICLATLGRGLGYLEQSLLGVQVPDLEPGEVDAVDIVLGGAEVVLGDRGQLQHLGGGHGGHLGLKTETRDGTCPRPKWKITYLGVFSLVELSSFAVIINVAHNS